MLQDLRFAVRLLKRDRAFTIAAVLTLALGIGLMTTVFSLVDGVLFRRLPYGDPERLVAMTGAVRSENQRSLAVSWPDTQDWRAQASTLADLAAWGSTAPYRTRGTDSVVFPAKAVSRNFLGVLGVVPILGRDLSADDMLSTAEKSALITYRAWQRAFGGDHSVIGRSLDILPGRIRIVGVLPRDFVFPGSALVEQPDLLLPLILPPETAASRNVRMFFPVARLAPGASLPQARAELDAIAQRLQPLFVPRPNVFPRAGFDGVTIAPLGEYMANRSRWSLRLAFATVSLVLVIACINIANLLLARGLDRHRELAIRSAIGAGGWRLFRQLLVESALLAAAGVSGGVLLAWLTFDFVVRAVPATLFLLGTPEIDLRVLAFAIGCGVSTVALFGALPAVQLARTPLVTTLAAGSRTAAHGRGAAGGLLVALESGLAMVLLAGGGLMANSFLRVHLQETGFSDPGGVLTMEATFGTPERLPNTREAEAFASMLLERVRGLPGVTGAALTNNLLTRTYFGSPFRLPSGARRGAYLLIVSPDYFRVMGIPLKAGRTFDPATDEPGRVVVVNENVAEAFWPGTNPVGRVLESRTHSAQVIGVVANTRDVALDVEMPPNIYVQHGTWAGPTNTTLIVRTSASPASLSREIREAVRILDPDVALTAATTLDAGLSASAAMRRFSLLLFGVFAGAGLLLASAGVYALVAYAVARRTKEIGIRKALGAQWRHIRRTIAGGVLGWVGIGLAAGLGGALVLSRALRSLLYHVEPTDPLTFAVVVLLLLTAAAAAAIVPARRALRVDPVIALRAE